MPLTIKNPNSTLNSLKRATGRHEVKLRTSSEALRPKKRGLYGPNLVKNRWFLRRSELQKASWEPAGHLTEVHLKELSGRLEAYSCPGGALALRDNGRRVHDVRQRLFQRLAETDSPSNWPRFASIPLGSGDFCWFSTPFRWFAIPFLGFSIPF